MSVFRVRFKVGGGHVHCRVFVARSKNTTFAKSGDLCVTKGEEFESLVRCFSGADFLSDDEDVGMLEACRS
jgi:hypothetical protein